MSVPQKTIESSRALLGSRLGDNVERILGEIRASANDSGASPDSERVSFKVNQSGYGVLVRVWSEGPCHTLSVTIELVEPLGYRP